MILTQVLCPERAQLFFIMATAFISLCAIRCLFALLLIQYIDSNHFPFSIGIITVHPFLFVPIMVYDNIIPPSSICQ